MLLSIIFFFIVTIGLGFLIDIFIKKWEADWFEKLVIRLGFGLASIPVLGIILNFFHLIDWRIFLGLAIIIFSINLYLKRKNLKEFFPKFTNFNFLRITKKQIYFVLLLIMFGITTYMYIYGSFVYPWFESSDPYIYAATSKYIALEKTYSTPFHFTHFAEPYTQGYQIVMGVLHQTNDSIYWNMKFFNALIISFSILFFFFFAKRFTKNQDMALASTFALFAIPCWVSHFIFSLNFNMALFPVFFYVLLKIQDSKKWKYFSIIVFASILINHANSALTITMFLMIYYLSKVFVEEKLNVDILHTGFFGLLISLFFYVPSYLKHSHLIGVQGGIGGLDQIFLIFFKIFSSWFLTILFIVSLIILIFVYLKREKIFIPIKKLLQKKNIKLMLFSVFFIILMGILIFPSRKIIDIKGSGTRDYGLKDFFIAQKGNMINNPIGVGLVLMILFSIGIIIILFNYKKLFKKENFWLSTTLNWTIISLLIMLGSYFSIMYIPFRMWTFFAIFASLIIGFSVINLLKLVKQKYLKILFIIIIVILVIPTSFSQKYWHNTTTWPEHFIVVPESRDLYIWMRDGGLPKDSLVLPLCHSPIITISYDMLANPWEKKYLSDYYSSSKDFEPFYMNSLLETIDQNYILLKENDYEYVILGMSCVVEMGHDQALIESRIKEMINSPRFLLIKSTKSEFLFKVE